MKRFAQASTRHRFSVLEKLAFLGNCYPSINGIWRAEWCTRQEPALRHIESASHHRHSTKVCICGARILAGAPGKTLRIRGSDVPHWHKADIAFGARNVRFWGQSGHGQPSCTENFVGADCVRRRLLFWEVAAERWLWFI